MGERVRAALEADPDSVLGGALEATGHPELGNDLGSGVRLVDEPITALRGCDALIDFSLPAASLATVRTAAELGIPCAIGTTGFSPAERTAIEELGTRVAIVLAANFSVAVNVLGHVVSEATRLLGPGYDAEIVELHHAAKRDAPSGTALWLGELVAEARGSDLEKVAVRARDGETGERPSDAIGLQSLRAGDAPGEHTVFLVGAGERLELTHRAFTRDHFARGAVRAARWTVGRTAGLYSMRDVLGL